MLKFIKHHLDTIAGVEVYPIISLLLFFLVFVTMLVMVYKLPKDNINEKRNLPLLDNDLNEFNHE